MQDNCSWIGIGVELTPQITQQCNKLNDKISLVNPASYKFSQNNRPHINLYDLDVPENNIPEITSALSTTLKNIRPFKVKILKIDYFRFGAIFLEVEKHPLLENLHSTVVSTIAKYKGSCVCKDYLQPWRKHTPEQADMLEKYGNPFVLKEFHPHISIGFIKTTEEMLKTHVENLNKLFTTSSFEVAKISLVNDAEKGHVALATFDLK